jgi:hypothetical protein
VAGSREKRAKVDAEQTRTGVREELVGVA